MAFLQQLMGGGQQPAPKPQDDTSNLPHYDAGGNVAVPTTNLSNPTNGTAFVPHAGQSPEQVWGDTAGNMNNQIGHLVPGASALTPVVSTVAGTAGQIGADAINGLGKTMQGIGSAFTAQNNYNAQLAPQMQSDYSGVINQSAVNALSGYDQFLQNQGQQQGVANQLQNTSGQYQNIVNGTGPNPAQAMLANTTGQNVSQQAALMAGQRGAGANAGLLARQNAMQGAGIQQQAVGQGAALQANQSLNALSGLQSNQVAQGNLYGQMGSQVQGQQNVNAGLFSNAAQAQNAQNANNIANYGMEQGINSKVSQSNADAVNKTTSGLMGGAASLFSLAEGGKVPSANGPKSMVAQILKGGHGYAKGGKVVPAMVSPGEKYLNPREAKKVAEGKASPAKEGKVIPGKPKFKGNNYANDTVPAKLESGGVIIPNSVMQSDDPIKGAAAFVRAHLGRSSGLKRK